MTTYALGPGDHGAYRKMLTAGVVDVVTFEDDIRRVEVFSNGAADLYVTTDGQEPAVGDSRSWEIPAGSPVAKIVPVADATGATVVVQLVADGELVYSVSEATL